MQDYIIATSSTSDLPRTWLEAHQIPFIAYTFTDGTSVFEDDCREESRQDLYTKMRAGARYKTSMINEYTYYEFFKGLVEQGKDVIFLDMSEKMSVSFQNSRMASSRIAADYPGRKLYLMDTRCISGGLGLLVEKMVLMKEDGASFEDVVAWGEAHKLEVAHRFTVNDLNYLKAGGRVSNASALVGTILNIKPVLYVPDTGTLDVVSKVRGRKAALQKILAGILHDLSACDCRGAVVRILQADCVPDAEWVRDGILEAHPELAEVSITGLGVVIGAHCGPGLLAVFYLCKGRQPE
ncbi:MAG: DegV family protein [Lachnospiraceae bacterium]|nr:DegV family protein [Lachnospiraceae bacterium]